MSLSKLLLVLTLVACQGVVRGPDSYGSGPQRSERKRTLEQSKYGLFIHYLNSNPNPPHPGGIDNGLWDVTVNSFQIDRFVGDLKRTGAAYVIFTIGQTSENFASPNAVLEQAAAIAYNRPDLNHPGAFTSRRDLIGELAVRLEQEGIAFYPYLPASSWYGFANGLSWVTPRIVEEYARRWGTAVDGWWFDGCYPSLSGLFKTPSLAKQSTDSLIAAAKLGNAKAVVFCNSESGTRLVHSENQGAIGGEEDFFHRLPDGELLFESQRIRWHVASYLGSNWGAPDLKRYAQFFGKTYLPRYIKRVSDLGGAVSVDMAVTADGALIGEQLEVMDLVKAHLRDGLPLSQDSNLALGKIAFLKSNLAPFANVPAAGSGTDGFGHRWLFWPLFGNNGQRDAFFAAPENQIAWNYMVDLEAISRFNQVLVTFPPGRFATSFVVESSNDAQTWQRQAVGTAGSAGTQTLSFADVEARYVRVRAVLPNAANQTGGQMAIAEFEVYRR
jgi:F5/8 type C domain